MASGIFNISKGSIPEKVRNGDSAIGVLLLKAALADSDLVAFDDLEALLADSGNTEADFTNYARKTSITATLNVDDSNNIVSVNMPDQTWTNAGGTTNNDLAKLVIFYDEGGTDATRVPLTHHDFTESTGGGDLTAVIDSSGFYTA